MMSIQTPVSNYKHDDFCENLPVGDLGGLLLGTGIGFLIDGGVVNLGKTFSGSRLLFLIEE